MLHDAPLAQKFAQRLLEEGIYAIGFFFPVVPKDQARIRTQISAAHTREHLDQAIDAFTRIGRELDVIKACNAASPALVGAASATPAGNVSKTADGRRHWIRAWSGPQLGVEE